MRICRNSALSRCRAKELNQLRKGASLLMLPDAHDGAAPGMQGIIDSDLEHALCIY